MENAMLYGLVESFKRYCDDEEQINLVQNSLSGKFNNKLAFALASKKVKASANMIIAGALYKNGVINGSNINTDTMELIMKLKKANTAEKVLLSSSDDVRIAIIKIVERLIYISNCEEVATVEEMKSISEETVKYYIAMADALGMHDIKVELEEKIFKYLNPSVYNKIREVVKINETGTIAVEDELVRCLKDNLMDFNISDIRFRVKPPYGIYSKMCKNTYLDAIPDLYSITLVLDETGEKSKYKCYSCLGEVHRLFKYKPNSFVDYIALPNSNGYRSVNSTIFCYDTQTRLKICTKEMDQINRYGITSDLYSKSKEEVNSQINKITLYNELKGIYKKLCTDYYDDVNFDELYRELEELCKISRKHVFNEKARTLSLFYQTKKLCENLKEGAIANEKLVNEEIEVLRKQK